MGCSSFEDSLDPTALEAAQPALLHLAGRGDRELVDDLDAAIAKVLAAGAVQEGETCDAAYGRIAMFADPFGHGFCLIEFGPQGYDALLPPG